MPLRTWLSVLLLVCLPWHPAGADEIRVGLVLGGGGARGIAHIGVLKVLERERVPIHAIAGTSMGAAVGALYASGYSAEELETIIGAIDWRDALRDGPPRGDLPMARKEESLRVLADIEMGYGEGRLKLPRGVLQGQNLQVLLQRLFLRAGDVGHFDELPIPFRAVAADIVTGEAVVFERGALPEVVRASMSVPAAFQPIRIDGRLLVDGGVVDNVPVDVARAMGVTHLIVVDVGEPLLPEEHLNSPLSITLQMVSVLMHAQTQRRLESLGERDVLIRPELGDIGSTQFDRAADTLAPGEAAAEAVIDHLRSLALSPSDYARHRAARGRPRDELPVVEFVRVNANHSRTARLVAARMSALSGKPLDLDALEAGIAAAYGDGRYERISWRIVEDDAGRTGIEILPVDKGWGPTLIRFGLQLSDDFRGNSSYQLSAEGSTPGWGEGLLQGRASIGRLTSLEGEYYSPFGFTGQYFLQPYAGVRATNIPLSLGDREIARLHQDRAFIGVRVGWDATHATRLGAGIERGRDRVRQRIGAPGGFDPLSSPYGAIVIGLTHDTLDNSVFPGSGQRLDLRSEIYRPALGSEDSEEVFRLAWNAAGRFGATRVLGGVRVSHASRDNAVLQGFDQLGGLGNLSGYGENELLGSQLFLARGLFYRPFSDAERLFSLPAYYGISLEAGNVWQDQRAVSIDSLIYAGSIFTGIETPLGPMLIGYGRASSGRHAFYIAFGNVIRGVR
ncbi:MAG TPA: patatin-like phospholipase family protein [Xanthomonadaceae bacterium]|nr:patatin-like phospholipase family protein [Xanthomonadaceae bacterium]